MATPFDTSGITVGSDDLKRYDGLTQNLITLLQSTVEAAGDVEGLVELGGERVTYTQLWDRATRVAGGLRAKVQSPVTGSRIGCPTATSGSMPSGGRCS